MAQDNKPTAKQLSALNRNYESFLYDALENAKGKGAWRTAQAIEEAISGGIIMDALSLITSRQVISRAIANSCTSRHQLLPEVKNALAIFFESRRVWVDLDWKSTDE